MNYFIGIDLGKNMSIAIVKLTDAPELHDTPKPQLVDSIYVDLSKGEPTKDDDSHAMAYRFEVCQNVVRTALSPYQNDRCWVAVEKPPIMRFQPIATAHLNGYFAAVVLVLRELSLVWNAMAVTQWKARLKANAVFKDKTKKSVRSKLSKQMVAKRVQELIGVSYPGEDDRVDAVGIALACASERGGYKP